MMWTCRWIDGLAGGGAVELGDDDAVALQRFHHGFRQFLDGSEIGAEAVGGEFEQVAGGGVLRDDEAVALALRENVHEGEDVVVLEDLHARHLAAQDFREDVGAVVFAYKAHQKPSSS